jgi:TonB family protein
MHVGGFALVGASTGEALQRTHDGRGPFFLAFKESSFGSMDGARLAKTKEKAKTTSRPANEIGNVVGTQDASSPVRETDITASVVSATGRDGIGGGGDNGHESTLMNEYLASLRNELQSRIVYPHEAKSLRLSGRVEIEFNVDRHGYLTEISLAQSCEHAVLNRAALHLVRLLGQVGPPPEGFARDPVRVVVPLQYSIQR